MFTFKNLKFATLGLTGILAASIIAGCGSQSADNSNSKKNLKIGVVQLVEHNALDAANKGFIAGLKERGYIEGKNITVDQQNAQADQSNLQNIAQRFVANKEDLICAIATPAAQTIANATKDIPIVGTAITDYKSARLVASNEKPGGNVTGTTDMSPIKEQIDLLIKLFPNAKIIGTVYSSSEINSEIQVKAMTAYAKSKGLTVKTATVSTVNDIQQATQSLADKVDVFYEPTDNVIASAMPTLIAITNAAKRPVICGEPNMVKKGGLATYGIDYYKLGLQTGHMAADILDGKKKPADMPIESAKDLKITINKKNAALLGITLPADLTKDADIIE
ncbi:ABC transporter substrate-binding protein [Pectinatus brassicae]|uniref:Putative ABC transport system substrate-binding protein n=1 Tax=Pectinatus brassicae TaxID=862415 RepID=A0A840UIA8_9FIRM|nr:ABC transporter substrate-binding protein [Pectinatus brassicae]MBB5335297.1 putative ABC transport system substrate-binding protein [Pectinatus brassicae]